MKRTDRVKALHHTYLLFSRLYLNGVSADLLPYIYEIPVLRDTYSTWFSHDEAAAAHSQVFSQNISAYESTFLDSSGLLGGYYAETVKSFYREARITFRNGEDDIGHELAFLSSLCKAEFDHLQAGDQNQAAVLEALQYSFLQEHLLRWLPPFVIALSFSRQPFFQALGELTWHIVCDHWAVESRDLGSQLSGSFLDTKEPLLNDLLYGNKTGINQIAEYLVSPSRSGFYFGQQTISEIALSNQLPRGFGNRRQILTNLFRSAAQYELVAKVVDDLINHCHKWIHHYHQQTESCPQLEPFTAIWLERANMTATAIATMKAQLMEMTIA